MTSEARHFLKEMQTVRNRWAHANMEGFPVDDIYWDLDTLQRFSVVIGADEKLIQDLRETKAALLAVESQPPSEEGAENTTTPPEQKKDEAEFEPRQIVFIKSHPLKLASSCASSRRGERFTPCSLSAHAHWLPRKSGRTR